MPYVNYSQNKAHDQNILECIEKLSLFNILRCYMYKNKSAMPLDLSKRFHLALQASTASITSLLKKNYDLLSFFKHDGQTELDLLNKGGVRVVRPLDYELSVWQHVLQEEFVAYYRSRTEFESYSSLKCILY